MPKKLIKRFIPQAESMQSHSRLSLLRPLLNDPNLFHLNRYSVSMAFLVGVFLAFFPLPGQMILAATLAFWVRCNLPITVSLVWITNPITIAPIFLATYSLGTWLLEVPPIQFGDTLNLEIIKQEIVKIWRPLLIGSLCAGSFFSLSSYFLIRYLWRFYVIYQWKQRQKRRQLK